MKAYKKGNVKFIPYTLPWDRMPVDISSVFTNEKPAGKHGFLTAQGDGFAFEDGAEARFWGVNFNSGANFPSHGHSEKVAERLAQTGVNIVRLHQLDAEWSSPNIFRFSKGGFPKDTKSLDAESLDRLDYLVHCLKREGIYIYLDLLTYRRFKTQDGVRCAGSLKEGGKPYSNFDRTMIELQKSYCEQLWSHFNPYTRLAYRDDAVFVLCEITNENDLFHNGRDDIDIEAYRSDLEDAYREWAAGKGIEVPGGKICFEDRDGNIQAFKREVQRAYYDEMREYMRKIGVKIPIAGTNWSLNPNLLWTQMANDFTDGHAYWWFGDQRKFENRLMTGERSTIAVPLAFSRIPGKPYFVSEWDEPWPNLYRAECTLYLAAVGMLQGWSGFTVHTYRYGTNENESVTGKIGRDLVIGGKYYRGIFDTYNDPAKYGLFYHAALIVRRGDVRMGLKRVGMRTGDIGDPDTGMKSYGEMAAIPVTCERHRLETVLPGCPEGQDIVTGIGGETLDKSGGEVVSDTGELFRSWEKQYGWIDTPRTKAVYGMAGRQGEIALNGAAFRVETEFATVAMSSLTDDGIADSQNMLLTAVGKADTSGAVYNGDHSAVLEHGSGPVECEAVRAHVSFRTSRKNLIVWSVDAEGYYSGIVPSAYENGVFGFDIGNEFESIYYLIQDQ